MEEVRLSVRETLLKKFKKYRNDFRSVPHAVAYVYKTGLYKKVEILGLRTREFKTFQEWVEYEPPWGLGTTNKILKSILEKDGPDVLDMVYHSELKEHGGDRKSGENQDSNTTLKNDRGKSYTIRRLKRDNPELAEKVKKGEMSANAAAIEAGFRVPTKTVPLTEEGVVKFLDNFTPEQLNNIIKAVVSKMATTEKPK